MAQNDPTDRPSDEAIAALADKDPEQADKLLRIAGYSLEEWKRARNAPPAVESGHAAEPVAPPVPL